MVDCDRTTFDEMYGASCEIPNRIIAINNGEWIRESPGSFSNYTKITSEAYSGAIHQITLGTVSAGYDNYYYTIYDYIEIKRISPRSNV